MYGFNVKSVAFIITINVKCNFNILKIVKIVLGIKLYMVEILVKVSPIL